MTRGYARTGCGPRGCARSAWERVFRIVHRDHRGAPLAAVPAPSRFSDPQTGYVVLCAAETVRCAFWESSAATASHAAADASCAAPRPESALVVSIACEDLLALVDLRGDGSVHIGAPGGRCHPRRRPPAASGLTGC